MCKTKINRPENKSKRRNRGAGCRLRAINDETRPVAAVTVGAAVAAAVREKVQSHKPFAF